MTRGTAGSPSLPPPRLLQTAAVSCVELLSGGAVGVRVVRFVWGSGAAHRLPARPNCSWLSAGCMPEFRRRLPAFASRTVSFGALSRGCRVYSQGCGSLVPGYCPSWLLQYQFHVKAHQSWFSASEWVVVVVSMLMLAVQLVLKPLGFLLPLGLCFS